MNRRKFVKSSVISSLGITMASSLMSFSEDKKDDRLVVLHTNDTHSNIDPFPSNHKYYADRGGVQKRFELIESIRSKYENVLLLDAGDIFQGTPYFNMFGGELEMKLMTQLDYDAATMGNHDFDGGMEGFLKAKKYADFPFLTANYDFSDTILKNETKSYHIFHKGKFKIGVFGLGVELTGLVPDKLYGDTQYLNPIEIANKTASKLKDDLNCDIVICLSHLGYSYTSNKVSDTVLAKETANIDLIIGGHTHTFLKEVEGCNNKIGKTTLINQVGWGGINLGRVDFQMSKRNIDNKSSFIAL